MKNLVSKCLRLFPTCCLSATVVLLASTLSFAQASGTTSSGQPASRITAEINGNSMSPIPGSLHPLALPKFETGRLPAATKLQGVSLHFSRTSVQDADLQELIEAQQDPTSPHYHQWLSPEQFGSRFGIADSDIAKVQAWLERQGFTVDSVARGKGMIRFSGTVAQVESTFDTEMHTYALPSAKGLEQHFAPATALKVPSAVAPVVSGIRNLDDFRPTSHLISSRAVRPRPSFTSSVLGSVFMGPGDIVTVYDIAPAYSAGNTGNGQTITIVGQSAIAVSDIEAFQNAAGLTVKDPALILVPNTGTSKVFGGDETESDLDLEWSGAIAKGANVDFVYVGNNSNFSSFDSLQYAVDNKIGTIISSSYGTCETNMGGQTLETTFQQAATQGQTILSASGDSGSTDCFVGTNITNPTLATQESIAVDYPASSPYVTGVGGTEINPNNANYLTPGAGYWANAGTSDVISSALQYIPEIAWNEDTPGCGQADCLLSSGGGASTLFAKPNWQTGVAGIPSDGKRDVPDVALNASTGLPGYLFCSSDSTDWNIGQVASCNSGFRDASTGDLTFAGGTSFAAPIFAGMVAIINQQQNYAAGQGLLNPTLYQLAANSSTYASGFHDITAGNNDCLAGSGYCANTNGFAAGTGYDQVTGLGSIDLGNLVTLWPTSTSTLIGTSTTVAASNTAPQVGANVTFAIAVASTAGTTVPTGTVDVSIDGTAVTTLTLSSGAASYTTTFATAGAHTITASYSGDSAHATSTGSVTVTASAVSSNKGTFTVAATNITVTDGSVGSSTITVTPSGGYTGTVIFSLSGSTSTLNALTNVCPVYNNAAVTGTSSVTTTLTIDTNAVNCLATGAARKNKSIRAAGSIALVSGKGGGGAAGLLGCLILMAGLLGRSSKKLRMLAGVILLMTAGFAVSACGGGSNSSVSNPAKGSYTLTLTGTDSVTSTITSSNTFTLTIQ